MGHTHLKTSEASLYGNHHKLQDKDGTNPIYSWMMLQPDTNKFPDLNKEWVIPQMAIS